MQRMLIVKADATLLASDPLTKMLARQAGLAYAAAFKLMVGSMEQDNPVETPRLMNSAGRMMSVFHELLLVWVDQKSK